MIRARDQDGNAVDDPTADKLRELVEGLLHPGAFLIVERGSDESGETYAQVLLNDDGSLRAEYRDGSADRHFEAEAQNRRAAVDFLTGWAAGTPRWERALTWQRLENVPEPSPAPQRRRRPAPTAGKWPEDPGYAQIGCPISCVSTLFGLGLALVVLFVTGMAAVTWTPIWQGALAGLLIAMVAMIAMPSLTPYDRFSDTLFFAVVAILPAVATVVAVLLLA